MAAHYDSFDYPAYWEGREYEHESEVVALKSFLGEIKKIARVADVGGGYGRLVPYYIHRASTVHIIDPSSRLLKTAKDKQKKKAEDSRTKLRFIQSGIENIKNKTKANYYDLVLMVRVMHHIRNPEKAIKEVGRMVKPGGFFVLEIPNKIHSKAVVKNFLKGNFTFLLDIFPADRRSKKNKKRRTIPFLNYHPDAIYRMLEQSGFSVVDRRSVSNIRSRTIKRNLPLGFIVELEKIIQKPLAKINFGPSIFVLAKKK